MGGWLVCMSSYWRAGRVDVLGWLVSLVGLAVLLGWCWCQLCGWLVGRVVECSIRTVASRGQHGARWQSRHRVPAIGEARRGTQCQVEMVWPVGRLAVELVVGWLSTCYMCCL